MNNRLDYRLLILATVLLGGCGDQPIPTQQESANLDADGLRSTVVVNPAATGNGVAQTIGEALTMVAPGGRILVKPGTYNERLDITRGVIIEGSDVEAGAAVISQSLPLDPLSGSAPATESVIRVATSEPVLLRNLTVHHDNIRGVANITRPQEITLFHPVNLTIERVSFEGLSNVSPIVGNGVTVTRNAGSGPRASLVVRESRFDVGGIGISLGGDVNAIIEENSFDHARSRSVCIIANPTGQGTNATVPAGARINVEIRNNILANCGTDANRFPGRGFNTIAIQGAPGAPTTGEVNIVGNLFRTTPTLLGAPGACPASAILYEAYSGVIERNTITDVIKLCEFLAPGPPRNQPGAIYVGSVMGVRTADVSVRFNDIAGNAFAGLRIGKNQPGPITATCNWWGDPSGPSGTAGGGGDAVVVETGGAVPHTTPFATEPVSGSSSTSCVGG